MLPFRNPRFIIRRRLICFALCLTLLPTAAAILHAQVELLPLAHPATAALVRMYEYGAISEFPREHLPISRGLAIRLLQQASADTALPEFLRDQARYYLGELGADLHADARDVIISTGSQDRSVFEGAPGSRPWAILQVRDSATASRLVLEPVLDGEVRADPSTGGGTAVILQGGLELRGTALDHVGFSARVTNGTIFGDSAVVVRDPRISRAGAFGIAAFGRDIDYSSAHLRLDYDAVALEIAREPVQLGGGRSESLLLGSELPSTYDYLRFSLHLGKVAFTHLHGSLMPDIGKEIRGIGAHIPDRYLATHLLSIGPFAGIRVSLGESIVYSGRPFEIGYLNPFVFLRSQEHTYRDRDNANMYVALSFKPLEGLFVEGEFMLDDLRFSKMGEGHWANKTGWRLSGTSRGLLAGRVDIGLSYTRLEPYIFTHFNDTNAYSHDNTPLAAGGLQPNSWLAELAVGYDPLPNLSVRLTLAQGEHGANVYVADTLARNVGGDIHQTRRLGIDSDTVSFLDGVLEHLRRIRLEAEYEALRSVYLRLTAFDEGHGTARKQEIRFGVGIGAR